MGASRRPPVTDLGSWRAGRGPGFTPSRGLCGLGLVAAACGLLVLAATLHAYAQEVPAEYVLRDPASPEVTAQVEGIYGSALQLLGQHCVRWSDHQRRMYAEGVRIGLCNGLSRPLPEERVAAFLARFAAHAQGYASYSPAASCRFSDPDLTIEAMNWTMVGRCRGFAERETQGGSEALLRAFLQQLHALAEPAVAAALAEGLAVERADVLREMCLTQWTKMANDLLETGLKRPLSAQEIEEAARRLPTAWETAERVWETRVASGHGVEAGRERVVLEAYVHEASGILARATRPPQGDEDAQYVKTMERINQQQATGMDRWMRQQRRLHRLLSAPGRVEFAVEESQRAVLWVWAILALP